MPINVQEVRERHLRLEGKTLYEGHVLCDLAEALEEIESLKVQVQRATDEERAKVVAWLRTHPPIRYGEPDPMSTKEIAYRVERGDHHRKGV